MRIGDIGKAWNIIAQTVKKVGTGTLSATLYDTGQKGINRFRYMEIKDGPKGKRIDTYMSGKDDLFRESLKALDAGKTPPKWPKNDGHGHQVIKPQEAPEEWPKDDHGNPIVTLPKEGDKPRLTGQEGAESGVVYLRSSFIGKGPFEMDGPRGEVIIDKKKKT